MDPTSVIAWIVALGSLGLKFWAFVDATRFSRVDYQIVDRLPRVVWLVALGLGIVLQFWLGALQFDELLGPRSLTWLASIVLVGVYFLDLRPRLVRASAGPV